jgi:hypothetical protein
VAVQGLSVHGGVRVKTVNDAPLAISSNGTVLVNMTQYEGDRDPVRTLELALGDAGEVFIGVSLDSLEVADVLERLSRGAGRGTPPHAAR